MKKEKWFLNGVKWISAFLLFFAISLSAAKVCRAGAMYDVNVSTSYLALRSAKAYDNANEIGKLYNGDSVRVENTDDSTYWYVYSPKYDKYGYVNKNYLKAQTRASSGSSWTVSVSKGYLALRNAKAYDESNEIGELYSGDTVQVENMSDSTYWYVYAPTLGKYGYVNKKYLISQSSEDTWTVSVSKGYLALRNAKAYDESNEIGELYSGDTVQVQNTDDSTYWYVYSPTLGKYGYVNKNYLVSQSSGESWTVSVSKGYLALRNAKAYDESNEIGELYSGDTVKVQNKDDSTYWYVYAPTLGKSGYVNKKYLISQNPAETWTVSITRGYLALRKWKDYDESNEIGELYNGDTVEVQNKNDSTYWYVYSPTCGKYGYVNKNYLIR